MGTKPFLKWPGGKYRLAPLILEALGPGKRLIEPFVGSGAVFLNGSYEDYLLADSNADLINVYRQLTRGGEKFIDYARSFFHADTNTAGAYYGFRSVFNDTRDPRLRAALLIYFNRHGYNGLYRYNGKGAFNVPFGRYKKPLFPEQAMLNFIEKSRKARFVQQDFREVMQRAKPGDVCYCDPPYLPVSATSNFTAYSAGGFGWDDQVELAARARALAGKGVRVVLSNHDLPEVRELYAGAHIESVAVQRNISQKGDRRVKVDEVIAVF
jgi:DNA adenine methylase